MRYFRWDQNGGTAKSPTDRYRRPESRAASVANNLAEREMTKLHIDIHGPSTKINTKSFKG